MSSRLAITGLRSGLGRRGSDPPRDPTPLKGQRRPIGHQAVAEYIRPVKNDIKDSSKGVIEIVKSQALRNSNISNGHLMLWVKEHLNIS